ncbi:hypothetical protein CLOP_g17180 [Closterium sp. NIES-67]|nr:hypothetical protein CLOP_g17180 [Closterium sp. NIES-67]
MPETGGADDAPADGDEPYSWKEPAVVPRRGLDFLRPIAAPVPPPSVAPTAFDKPPRVEPPLPCSPTSTPYVLPPAVASSSRGPVKDRVDYATVSTVRYSVPCVSTVSSAKKQHTTKYTQQRINLGGQIRPPSPPRSPPPIKRPDEPPPPKLSTKGIIKQKYLIAEAKYKNYWLRYLPVADTYPY